MYRSIKRWSVTMSQVRMHLLSVRQSALYRGKEGKPSHAKTANVTNKSSPKSLGKSASHNYATKSPLVTTGRPKFTPKLALLLRLSPPPSNAPHRPTPVTIPNGIRIQSAVLPQDTFRTDRQTHTHRPTDWLGDSSTPLALTLAILIESDELKSKADILTRLKEFHA